MAGIYLTRNGVRSWYPVAEIDMDTAITTLLTATDLIAGYADDMDQPVHILYYGAPTSGLTDLITDGITDPRSDRQLVWFSGDTIKSCFEQRTLSAQPDDFYSMHGIADGLGTARNINTSYYDGTQYDQSSSRYTYNLPQTFAVGTYWYNDSCSAVIETERGYTLGLSYCNTFSPLGGFNLYQFWANAVWQNGPSGSSPDFTLYPQYGIQTPPVSAAYTMVMGYYNDPTSAAGEDPATPEGTICQLIHGTHDGTDYIGYCIHNMLTGAGYAMLLPGWVFGDLAPDPEPPIPEPGYYGDDSEPAGGTGTYTDTNDVPSVPASPYSILDGLGANGVHMYIVNQTQYGAVLDALWGTGTLSDALWQRWQNYKFNPLQGIVSSHFLPVELLPSSSGSAVIRMAGVDLSPTTAAVADSQVGRYDLGTLDIPEYFGSALDYSPYTQMRLYLPFCGMIEIDPDRVTGGRLSVSYLCDAMSGDVVAYVRCYDRTGACTYMYTASGNAAVTLPVTGNDQGTGQQLSALSGIVMGAVTGNPLGIASGAVSLLSTQQHMQQTGSFAGSVSLISDLTCRLQIIRPAPSKPAHGQELRGRPSDIGCTIGDLIGTGWSSFSAVHGDIPGATADEQQAVISMLHDGVIL